MSSRRNSLLSLGMMDFPGYSHRLELSDFEPDPFAPLAIHDVHPSARQIAAQQQSSYMGYRATGHDMMLSDRSESSGTSVPSLSAISYSSHGTNYHHGTNSSPLSSPLATLRTKDLVPSPSHYRPSRSLPLIPNRICSDSSSTMAMSPQMEPQDEEEMNQNRFKPFHEEKWSVRYKELLNFHKENGHAAVPHTYPKNPQLARWVKRQRRQYKLRRDGRPSTMTSDRLDLLNSVGFIWDSHDVNWREKLELLDAFRKEHSHCNVPSNYKDKKLATWVKCQRRQYKLYWDGKPSAMTPERILELEKAGFEWEIRSTVPRNPQPVHSAPSQPLAQPARHLQEEFHMLYHQSMSSDM